MGRRPVHSQAWKVPRSTWAESPEQAGLRASAEGTNFFHVRPPGFLLPAIFAHRLAFPALRPPLEEEY